MTRRRLTLALLLIAAMGATVAPIAPGGPHSHWSLR